MGEKNSLQQAKANGWNQLLFQPSAIEAATATKQAKEKYSNTDEE